MSSKAAAQVALDVDPGAAARAERVKQARRCAVRLGQIETVLLDISGKLPAFLREVQSIRADLQAAVAPINDEEAA